MSEQLAFDFGETTQSTASAEELVKTYSKIRDAREIISREFDEKDQILKEQLEVVKRGILDLMKSIGADSIKTAQGTILRTVKTRYWTTDWDSYNKFVIENNMPELYEKRIHQGNIKQLIEEDPNNIPKGLNSDSQYTVSVRRPK